MKRLALTFGTLLLSTLAATAQIVPPPPNSSYKFDPLLFDFDGDSRTRDIYPTTCSSGTEAVNLCGYRGTNWFVIANALAGQRYKIGLVQAVAGQRSDQYLAQSNIAPMLASNAGNFVIGYPAINDLTPLNGANYVNTNGYTVTPSNVANVVASNILTAVGQAVAKGKRVILLHEPGNPSISNSAIGVSSFTGSIAGNVLSVTSSTTGPIYTPQTVSINTITNQQQPDPGSQQLTGAGITAGTLVVAQLTGTDGNPCPSTNTATTALVSTCTGYAGTYLISNSLTISSEAMTGRYALTSALSDLNALEDAMVSAFPGAVQVINNNPALQLFSGSTTTINFKPGVNIDGDGTTTGTHFNALGGYYGAVSFNSQYQAPTPATDTNTSTPSDITGTNARALIASNALFLGSASGGTNSTCTLTSGTIPTGYQTACGASTTSLVVSAPATDTNQLYGSAAIPLAGNSLTIAITASAADLFRFFPAAPANGAWNLTDNLQGNYIVNVANGSSKCRVYSGIDYSTNLGTRTTYDLFSADDTASGGGSVDGPTTAYTLTMRTPPTPAPATATSKSFVRSVLNVSFSAAGSCTITISRPSLQRVRVYNPTTGTFSGWLLMRDLDPAANDNSPAWLSKAA